MSRKLESISIKQRGLNSYEKFEDKLLVSDLVLMLASISPIKGNTKLQKQVFLAWKTIFPNVAVDPGYIPWKYGAFSKTVEDTTRILLKKRLLKKSHDPSDGLLYSILPKGKKYLKKRMRDLDLDLRNLPDKKRDWDDWSVKGTLIHVYRKYPEYTTLTKVPSLKW